MKKVKSNTEASRFQKLNLKHYEYFNDRVYYPFQNDEIS